MSATYLPDVLEQAPGDTVALDAPTLVGGEPSIGTLANQQPLGSAQGTPDTPIMLAGTLAPDPNSGDPTYTFRVPDGAVDGELTVTDADGNSVVVYLRVVPQYVTENEYSGQGQGDVIALLAPGELNRILRDASATIDAYIGRTLRLLTYLERHRYENGTRKFWPYHLPIRSVSRIQFVTANSMRTDFNVSTDIYFDPDSRYIDILAFTIGNYELLGMLEHIGFSANVVELTLQSGYDYRRYPPQIRTACSMIAATYINNFRINKFGLGGLVQSQEGLMVRDVKGAMVLPPEVLPLLGRFFSRSFR